MSIHIFINDTRIKVGHFRNRWVKPIISMKKLKKALFLYKRYLQDWINYSNLDGSEKLKFLDSYPCIFDRTSSTYFDPHYFYQSIWAFRLIKESGVGYHVDIGSSTNYVGMLTTITKVAFVDIRPLSAQLVNYNPIHGSILALPFIDNSVRSISSLHVLEHIGLGRYGDPLDPMGTQNAALEINRVLSLGGNLYLSIPIGNPKVCFNAHRIHSPQQVLNYFKNLELTQFSAIDDTGMFIEKITPLELNNANYACGLFHFTKK